MPNVDEAKLMWSTTSGTVTTDDGRKKTVSLTEGYSITCDPDAQTIHILQAPSLPQTGDSHPDFTWVICKRKKPKRISPIYWIVEYVYEGEVGPGGPEDSPINDPPDISWGKVDSNEAIDEDINNEPIATVCGEKYDGVQMTISDMVLNVKRNYLAIDIPATHAYLHSVNSDNFAGFAPGTGHMTAFNANHVLADNLPQGYWEVTCAVTFRFPWRTTPERAWWKRVRHEGYYCKLDVDGTDVIRRGSGQDGEPTTRPVLLDANGYQLADPTDKSAVVWQEFQVYNELNYNSLGLLS